MKVNQILVAVIGSLSLFVGLAANTQSANAKVVKNSFLTTQRTIATTNSKKQVNLTIPKGTTVRAAGLKTINGHRYVYLNVDHLSYNLRQPILSGKATSTISRWVRLTATNFRQVSKPLYLSYYTVPTTTGTAYRTPLDSGDLWQGSTLPSDYQSASGTRVRVTDDGYLEYFTNTPYNYHKTVKPTDTEKVIAATHPGGSGKTTLTVTKGFSGLPFTQLTNGKSQLVIQLTSIHTITVVPSIDNAKSMLLNQISTIDGVDWANPKTEVTFPG